MYLLYPGLASLENGECPTGCPRSVSWGVKSCYVRFGLFVPNYLTGVPVNYVDKLSALSTGICPRRQMTQPINELAVTRIAICSKMFD